MEKISRREIGIELIIAAALIGGTALAFPWKNIISSPRKVENQVIAFLKETDVGSSAAGLKITSIKELPRDYIKVYAEFSTGRSYHPLDEPEKAHPAVPEFHSLELIIDQKPLSGSSYEVVYARDSNYLGNKPVENGVHAESDWNYITEKHIEENHDFDKTTPQRDIVWDNERYAPVTYIKFPEISDFEKGRISIIGEKDGYEIYGVFDKREKISEVPNMQSIIIPDSTGFYLWAKK
jgi:hypothetical protein